jgi:hypothetical protein
MRAHVTVTPGQSVNLYIQSQKNDTTPRVVNLGDMVTEYLDLLARDGLPFDSLSFLPTSKEETFVLVAPGAVSRLYFVIKQLIAEFYPGVTDQVLKEY